MEVSSSSRLEVTKHRTILPGALLQFVLRTVAETWGHFSLVILFPLRQISFCILNSAFASRQGQFIKAFLDDRFAGSPPPPRLRRLHLRRQEFAKCILTRNAERCLTSPYEQSHSALPH